MSEPAHHDARDAEPVASAQRVVEDVISQGPTEDPEAIGAELDAGLVDAGVQVPPEEHDRLVAAIDESAATDSSEAPVVGEATHLNPE